MTRSFWLLSVVAIGLGVAIACAKKTPEQKLTEAEASLQKRDPLGAIILAHEVLRENTTGPLALRARKLLVNCHLRGGDIKACRLALNEIISQVGLDNPEGQAAAQMKIQTYERVRQTTEALAQTHSFLQAVTTGTAFWANLMLKQGDLLRETDQLTTAQKVYGMVLRNSNLNKVYQLESLNRLAVSYATTQSAAAGIQFLEQYLADKPSSETIPHTYMIVGHLHSVIKEPDQSKTFYHKAFDVFEQMYKSASGADEKIGILIQYARAHDFAGNLDEAATLLRKGLQEFPTSASRIDLYYHLAGMFANKGKYDEAIQVCHEIPSQFPNDIRRIDSYFLAADCRRRQRKYEAANADYREITALFPGTPYAQYAMMEMRRTEEMRRREAETSATQAAALITSPTLAVTTGTILTSPSAAAITGRVSPALLPPSEASSSTAPQTRATVPQTTGGTTLKPSVP